MATGGQRAICTTNHLLSQVRYKPSRAFPSGNAKCRHYNFQRESRCAHCANILYNLRMTPMKPLNLNLVSFKYKRVARLPIEQGWSPRPAGRRGCPAPPSAEKNDCCPAPKYQCCQRCRVGTMCPMSRGHRLL